MSSGRSRLAPAPGVTEAARPPAIFPRDTRLPPRGGDASRPVRSLGLRSRGRRAAALRLALGLLACAAGPAAAEDGPDFVLGFSFQPAANERAFLVGGWTAAPVGAAVRLTLELEPEREPAVTTTAQVEGGGRFSTTIRIGRPLLLPGEYRLRAVLVGSSRPEGSATVRIGTVEEERAARGALDQRATEGRQRLFSLVTRLERVDGRPDADVALGTWDGELLGLKREFLELVAPGRFFLLYRQAELAELFLDLTVVELLERERREGKAPREDELLLRRIYLRELERRLGTTAEAPAGAGAPARSLLSQWLVSIKVLLGELRTGVGPERAGGTGAGEPSPTRLARLRSVELGAAEALPGFERLAGARVAAMDGLALLLGERGAKPPAASVALGDVEDAVHRMEEALLLDREAARIRVRSALTDLSRAAGEFLGPSEAPPEGAAEVAARAVAGLATDEACLFHFPEFQPLAGSAAACLLELSRSKKIAAPSNAPTSGTAQVKLAERRAYFRRTLEATLARLKELGQGRAERGGQAGHR